MLALRAIIRPGFYLNATNSRWYHPSARLSHQPLVEPYTWRARIWYRPDGKPRSKWKGCKVAFAVQLCRFLEEQLALVSLLSEMMHVDSKYSSYDLSKPQELASYFTEIGKCILRDHEELRKDPSPLRAMGSLIVEQPNYRQQLRKELELIHEVMQSNSTGHPMDAAEAVHLALRAMVKRLPELSENPLERAGGDAQTKDQKEDAGLDSG